MRSIVGKKCWVARVMMNSFVIDKDFADTSQDLTFKFG